MNNLNLSVKEILIAAAEVIRKRGWRKYSLGTSTTPVCIQGAIMDAGGHPDIQMQALGVFMLSVAENLHPWQWNDYVCESQEQAIAALEGAAGVIQ